MTSSFGSYGSYHLCFREKIEIESRAQAVFLWFEFYGLYNSCCQVKRAIFVVLWFL